MDAIESRIRFLRRLRPDERLAAAAAALAVAPPHEIQPLALVLTELAAKPGVTGGSPSRRRAETHATAARSAAAELACTWAALPTPARRIALATARGEWAAALETVEQSRWLGAGSSIAGLAADAGDAALLPHLVQILEQGEPRPAAAAAQTLLGLTLRLCDLSDLAVLGLDADLPALAPLLDPEAPLWTPDDVNALLGAIARAVEGFDQHRRKEVLLAALVMLERPRQTIAGQDPLATLASDPDSAAGATLRSAFRRARAPIARHRAWLWLREASVALACAERVGRAATHQDHALVLSLGHLALAPARAKHLGLVRIATIPAPADARPPNVADAHRLHPTGPVPDRAALAALPPGCRRRVPGLVAALDGDRSTRAVALDPLLTDPDPIARLNTARAAEGEFVRDFCFDPEPSIARHAALRVSSVGVPESDRLRAGDRSREQAARALGRSALPAARRIAADELDRLAPGVSAPSRLLAARRLLARDPDAFAAWARGMIESGEVAPGVQAIMVARRVGGVATIEPALLAIVRDSLQAPAAGASRLAATAVAALGDLRLARADGVLQESLKRHPDARVRANAAEALGRSAAVAVRASLPDQTASEPHHRVRASVLRAVLQPWPEAKPELRTHAADSVSTMLADPRPEHRLAAVWVVQRSLRAGLEGRLGQRWERLAGRIRWLADEDTDADVRARAIVVRSRLDAAFVGLGPREMGDR